MGPFRPIAAGPLADLLSKAIEDMSLTLQTLDQLPKAAEVLVEEGKLAAVRTLAQWRVG
jgi:hypothetical protein